MRRNGNSGPTRPSPVIRCAIDTRKSTDEGLDQEFNSLDAQREAAEACLKSQQHDFALVLPVRQVVRPKLNRVYMARRKLCGGLCSYG